MVPELSPYEDTIARRLTIRVGGMEGGREGGGRAHKYVPDLPPTPRPPTTTRPCPNVTRLSAPCQNGEKLSGLELAADKCKINKRAGFGWKSKQVWY